MNGLTNEENERYAANLALCEIDLPGQQKLKSASVLVCGAGALASPVLLYLAAAGVGTLGIADGDRVSLGNLQRQIVHRTDSVGRLKTESAEAAVKALNPGVKVRLHNVMLTADNIAEVASAYDLLIDCTDNYPTRLMLSDAAAALAKPLCFAAVSRFEAQLTTQLPGSRLYREIFPEAPTSEQINCSSCVNSGVLNAVAGVAGAMQAAEAIKLITGVGEPLINRLLLIDLLTFKFTTIRLQ
ncbi:MAG: HesA/MoeB/ThiF family protein [Muribaculaceae bacterium]|nr:HesA/MoeB/ThiF family protein [Muribaculaceae bacterium]